MGKPKPLNATDRTRLTRTKIEGRNVLQYWDPKKGKVIQSYTQIHLAWAASEKCNPHNLPPPILRSRAQAWPCCSASSPSASTSRSSSGCSRSTAPSATCCAATCSSTATRRRAPSLPPRTPLVRPSPPPPSCPPPVAPSRAPRPLAPSQVRRKAEAAVGLLATTSDGESAAHGLVDLMPKKKELLETAIAQAKAEAEALKEATAHYTAVELGSPHSS